MKLFIIKTDVHILNLTGSPLVEISSISALESSNLNKNLVSSYIQKNK